MRRSPEVNAPKGKADLTDYVTVKGDRPQISVDSQYIFVFTFDSDNHTPLQENRKFEPEGQTTLLIMLSLSFLKYCLDQSWLNHRKTKPILCCGSGKR